MKTRIITLSTILIIICLASIGFTNWNTTKTDNIKLSKVESIVPENQNLYTINKRIPDLYYGVDARFAAVKISDVHKATSIYDFLNEEEKNQIAHINTVKLIMVGNNQLSNKRAYGETEHLTNEQIKLLKSTDYFSHFTIRTEFKAKNKDTGKLEERFFGPHTTVVPDKQATYIDGKDALINYLKENSQEYMNVIEDEKLGAIKIAFKITKEGKVSSVEHDAMTTGYPSIDEKFMQLIKDISGKWSPAENAQGEKMEQELVFTFGPANGC